MVLSSSLLPLLLLSLVGFGVADDDADGIPDSIESEQWYRDAGGSPDRADLWVECDVMRRVAPPEPFVIDASAATFAAGPRTNPDGSTGIALHLTFDDRLPYAPLLGDDTFEGLYTATMAIRDAHFDAAPFNGAHAEAMRPYVYYCLYVNAINTLGTSGIAFDSGNPGGGIPGDTFIVSIGGLKSVYGSFHDPEARRWAVGTFLHELGHNLGLTHGGSPPAEHVTFKPHYLSVMNYHFQQGFVTVDEEGHLRRLDYWDFSRFVPGAVNERRLREERGVRGPAPVRTPDGQPLVGLMTTCAPTWTVWHDWNGPADFNCNGVIDAGRVSADLNDDRRLEPFGAPWVDWDHLLLGDQRATRRARSLALQDEMDLDTARQLEQQLRRARPAQSR